MNKDQPLHSHADSEVQNTQKSTKTNDKSRNEDQSDRCPLEKYPIYDPKPIKWNPPSSYFQPKKEIEIPEEYTPPPKKPAREVNFDLLSPNEKKLYGRSLYEKDLEIIKLKQQRYPQKIDIVNRSPVNNCKPPSIFYREEAIRDMKNQELQEYEEKMKRKKKKIERKQRKQFQIEKQKIDEVRRAREIDRKIQNEYFEEERRHELKRRQDQIKARNIPTDRPTQASRLKEEVNHKKIEKAKIEERREKFNDEMRKNSINSDAKKIHAIVNDLNSRIETPSNAKKMRKQLHKNQRSYQAWLNLTENANKARETLLEKLIYQYDL